jgi:hypothetical protein
LLARLEIDREGRKAERKAYQQELKKMMEGMLRDKQDTWLGEKQDGQKEMTACQEATERTEPNPRMMQSIGSIKGSPRKKLQ